MSGADDGARALTANSDRAMICSEPGPTSFHTARSHKGYGAHHCTFTPDAGQLAVSIPQFVADGTFDPGAFRAYLARAEALGFESAWVGER